MKRLILLTLAMYAATAGYAQQIAVPLKLYFADDSSKYFSSAMQPTVKIADLSPFKNIPAAPLMKAVYSVTAMSGPQGEAGFYVYVGLDKEKGEKYIIVDSNSNLDFGDDQMYTFSLDGYDTYTNLREYMPTLFVPVRIGSTQTRVKIWPYSAYDHHSDPDDQMLDFLPTTAYFYRDTVNINSTDVTVTANDIGIDIVPSDRLSAGTNFTFITKDNLSAKSYNIGDTLVVADKMLHLSSLEDNVLYLDDLGLFADSSKVGGLLPVLTARDLDDNKPRTLNDSLRGKYVLIDFWGSWCAPCVAALPHLAALSRETSGRGDVRIIGITLEDGPRDVAKAKSIMERMGVDWPVYWQEKSGLNSPDTPTGKLNIFFFPSYVIADKNGRIVFTSADNPAEEDALEVFRRLIDAR